MVDDPANSYLDISQAAFLSDHEKKLAVIIFLESRTQDPAS